MILHDATMRLVREGRQVISADHETCEGLHKPPPPFFGIQRSPLKQLVVSLLVLLARLLAALLYQHRIWLFPAPHSTIDFSEESAPHLISPKSAWVFAAPHFGLSSNFNNQQHRTRFSPTPHLVFSEFHIVLAQHLRIPSTALDFFSKLCQIINIALSHWRTSTALDFPLLHCIMHTISTPHLIFFTFLYSINTPHLTSYPNFVIVSTSHVSCP